MALLPVQFCGRFRRAMGARSHRHQGTHCNYAQCQLIIIAQWLRDETAERWILRQLIITGLQDCGRKFGMLTQVPVLVTEQAQGDDGSDTGRQSNTRHCFCGGPADSSNNELPQLRLCYVIIFDVFKGLQKPLQG